MADMRKVACTVRGYAFVTTMLSSGARRRTPQRASSLLLTVAAAVTLGLAATPASASSSCAQLAKEFSRPNTAITAAQTVPAGTFVTPDGVSLPDLPQFCRVEGFSTPTDDSHIKFEVWVPESGWNSKYLQVGCGGFCGSITYGGMAEPLRRGYAVAGTDDGHTAVEVDASWAVDHPQKVVDFGYRSQKETTDIAKDLIGVLKSSTIRRSYFMGCSNGGREALMEAQRYPQDFDGIVAGAPGSNFTHLMTTFVWDQLALAASPGGKLSQLDLNAVSKAILTQCAGKDGGLTTDQFLNNPLACHIDARSLPLAKDKIEVIEKIFSGPPGIFPGYRVTADQAGNPADWPAWLMGPGDTAQGAQIPFGNNFFRQVVFPNSDWSPTAFTIEQNAREADSRVGAAVNSTSPDLRAFRQHGGKLIEYIGWADTGVPPESAVNYHDAVVKELGGHDDIRSFYRLFMVPGMTHCAGGPGPNAFGQTYGVNGPHPSDPTDDILSALDRWVESNKAPANIVATKYVNDDPRQGVSLQRPLCPFPEAAKYDGSGSTTSAASYACLKPRED